MRRPWLDVRLLALPCIFVARVVCSDNIVKDALGDVHNTQTETLAPTGFSAPIGTAESALPNVLLTVTSSTNPLATSATSNAPPAISSIPSTTSTGSVCSSTAPFASPSSTPDPDLVWQIPLVRSKNGWAVNVVDNSPGYSNYTTWKLSIGTQLMCTPLSAGKANSTVINTVTNDTAANELLFGSYNYSIWLGHGVETTVTKSDSEDITNGTPPIPSSVPFSIVLGGEDGALNGSLVLGTGYDASRVRDGDSWSKTSPGADFFTNGKCESFGRVQLNSGSSAPDVLASLDFNSPLISMVGIDGDFCGKDLDISIPVLQGDADASVTISIPAALLSEGSACTQSSNAPSSYSIRRRQDPPSRSITLGQPFFQAAYGVFDPTGDLYLAQAVSNPNPSQSPEIYAFNSTQPIRSKANPALPSPVSAQSSSSSSKSILGPVLGGVFGGLAGLAIIAAIAFFLLRRRRTRHAMLRLRTPSSPDFEMDRKAPLASSTAMVRAAAADPVSHIVVIPSQRSDAYSPIASHDPDPLADNPPRKPAPRVRVGQTPSPGPTSTPQLRHSVVNNIDDVEDDDDEGEEVQRQRRSSHDSLDLDSLEARRPSDELMRDAAAARRDSLEQIEARRGVGGYFVEDRSSLS